jgi:hypothetical protein
MVYRLIRNTSTHTHMRTHANTHSHSQTHTHTHIHTHTHTTGVGCPPEQQELGTAAARAPAMPAALASLRALPDQAGCMSHAYGWQVACHMRMAGQNRICTPYLTVYLVISLPKILSTHHIYVFKGFG